jgi:hypothetical protein
VNTVEEDFNMFVDEETQRLTMRENETVYWISDSGASGHMSFNRELFSELSPSVMKSLTMANGSKAQIEGVGKINCTVQSVSGPLRVTLNNVMLIPSLERNLLSIRTIINEGHSVKFNKHGRVLKLKEKYPVKFIPHGKMYVLKCQHSVSRKKKEIAVGNYANKDKQSLKLWHQRFGHAGKGMLKRLQESVSGLQIEDEENYSKSCEVCAEAKMPKTSFKSSTRRATRILELVHSDISGPVRTPTPEGYRYAINFVDDASRFVVVYLMRNKSEALEKLKEFEATYGTPQTLNVGALKEKLDESQTAIQRESVDTSSKLRALRTDNGGEYISKEFTKYCRDRRIRRELTIARIPQQNGVAERN